MADTMIHKLTWRERATFFLRLMYLAILLDVCTTFFYLSMTNTYREGNPLVAWFTQYLGIAWVLLIFFSLCAIAFYQFEKTVIPSIARKRKGLWVLVKKLTIPFFLFGLALRTFVIITNIAFSASGMAQ